MRVLYHLTVCPFSRSVRLALEEKHLDFRLVSEKPWEEREEFIGLNPAGEFPVLKEETGQAICQTYPLYEYLEEKYPSAQKLITGTPQEKAEIRRLCVWVNEKFYREVTKRLVWEKLLKRFYKNGCAEAKIMRAGTIALAHHLQYFSWLLEGRDWIAGNQISMADFVLAAHLSSIDFVGSMPWVKFPCVKNWYACIKSRPSFRPLLGDNFPGVTPPASYRDLDF